MLGLQCKRSAMGMLQFKIIDIFVLCIYQIDLLTDTYYTYVVLPIVNVHTYFSKVTIEMQHIPS
jgi:hypothetical protein